MAGNIKVEIVTPEKAVVSEDAQIVVAPGAQGEFGVLVGHTPFMTPLKAGSVRYTDAGGKEREVFVSGGFAEALPDKVTVLAESAERRSDIDAERAGASKDSAEKRLAEDRSSEDIDFIRARAALERALQRLQIISSRN